MRRLLSGILRRLGARSGREKHVLSPAEFTREYVDLLTRSRPELKVAVVHDLELALTTPDGRDGSTFLDNAYQIYRHDPREKEKVLHAYLAAAIEGPRDHDAPVDRRQVVPVVKDRGWLEDMQATLRDRGAKKLPVPVCEDFTDELVIVYGEDTPKNIRYPTGQLFAEANISTSELRVLAVANLRRLLPPIERAGGNGVFMFTAGGYYEASLLLLDTIWAGLRAEVKGDVVVAIPTRDVLVATGSEHPDGLKAIMQVVRQAWQDGAYKLTPKLFVYRDGQFQVFRTG